MYYRSSLRITLGKIVYTQDVHANDRAIGLTDVSTHRHLNPLFQMKTLQPLDTSTHDIKSFQTLPVQTFQPMF